MYGYALSFKEMISKSETLPKLSTCKSAAKRLITDHLRFLADHFSLKFYSHSALRLSRQNANLHLQKKKWERKRDRARETCCNLFFQQKFWCALKENSRAQKASEKMTKNEKKRLLGKRDIRLRRNTFISLMESKPWIIVWSNIWHCYFPEVADTHWQNLSARRDHLIFSLSFLVNHTTFIKACCHTDGLKNQWQRRTSRPLRRHIVREIVCGVKKDGW